MTNFPDGMTARDWDHVEGRAYICNETDPINEKYRCELDAGHFGDHRAGDRTWEDTTTTAAKRRYWLERHGYEVPS